MLFTLPFGLLIMCFALLFGLSAVGDGAEVLGDDPGRNRNGRRSRRSKPARQRITRRGRSRSTRQSGIAGSVTNADDSTSESAADYFGYDATGADLFDESFDEAARRLDDEARLHMDQVLGDGT